MVDLLAYVGDVMAENNIPYEFGEWTQPVSYPYFVGTYTETDYRFEDACTSGTLLIDGWARGEGARLALAEVTDQIQKIFEDLETVREDRAFFIRYGGASPVPSGEEDLFKVTITLYTYEWKGD